MNNTGLFQNLISSSQHSRHICMVNIEIQKLTFLISKPGFETQQHKYVSLKSTTLFSLLHNELREVKTTLTPLLCHIFQFLNTLTITALATYLCCPSKIQWFRKCDIFGISFKLPLSRLCGKQSTVDNIRENKNKPWETQISRDHKQLLC